MAAEPYTGTIRTRTAQGKPNSFRFEADDVAGNPVTFPDLGDRASIVVPQGGLQIVDMTLRPNASGNFGTDTDTLQLRKGVSDLPIFLDNDLLGDTSTDRATRLQDLLGQWLEPGQEYTLLQA